MQRAQLQWTATYPSDGRRKENHQRVEQGGTVLLHVLFAVHAVSFLRCVLSIFTSTGYPTPIYRPEPVLAEELRDQLGDALSPFRTGAFAKFASCVLQLSGVLPSQHCLWAPDPAAPLAEVLDPVAEGLGKLNELTESVAHPDEEEEDEDVAKRPEYWGLRVRDLSEFNTSIHDDLVAYCHDHHVHFENGHCLHLCKHGANCPWGDHEGVLHDKTRDASRMPGMPLLPNMHAVTRLLRLETDSVIVALELIRLGRTPRVQPEPPPTIITDHHPQDAPVPTSHLCLPSLSVRVSFQS